MTFEDSMAQAYEAFNQKSKELLELFEEEVLKFFPTKRFKVHSQLDAFSPEKEYVVAVDYAYVSWLGHRLNVLVKIDEYENNVLVREFDIPSDFLLDVVYCNT
jgi:hypothetical protein